MDGKEISTDPTRTEKTQSVVRGIDILNNSIVCSWAPSRQKNGKVDECEEMGSLEIMDAISCL